MPAARDACELRVGAVGSSSVWLLSFRHTRRLIHTTPRFAALCLLCFLLAAALPNVAVQAQATQHQNDYRGSVLSRINVTGEWSAFRSSLLEGNGTSESPSEKTFVETCFTDARVSVFTKDVLSCQCGKQDVPAFVRLRRAATKFAGLVSPGTQDAAAVESAACSVDVRCTGNSGTRHVVVRGCALVGKDADASMHVVPEGKSTRPILPLAVEFFTYDTEVKRVEMYGTVRNANTLQARTTYRVRLSGNAVDDEYGLWQVQMKHGGFMALGEVKDALGTSYDMFHDRFGAPDTAANRYDSTTARRTNLTSFSAMMSVRRSIVAAHLAYRDEELNANVYATGQVDGNGRLNAYDVRRVSDTAAFRVRAGGVSTQRLYADDADICSGESWQGAPATATLVLKGLNINNAEEGSWRRRRPRMRRSQASPESFEVSADALLACSAIHGRPKQVLQPVLFQPKSMRFSRSLLNHLCVSSNGNSTDIMLDPVQLRYDLESTILISGNIDGSASLVFSTTLTIGETLSFGRISISTLNPQPVSVLASYATFNRPLLVGDGDPLVDFEFAIGVGDSGAPTLRLVGPSFESQSTFESAPCSTPRSFVGTWMTLRGDVAKFDSLGGISSFQFHKDSRWANSITSASWPGTTAAHSEQIRLETAPASSPSQLDVINVGGSLVVKHVSLQAVYTMGADVPLLIASSSWSKQGGSFEIPNGSFELSFEDDDDVATFTISSLPSSPQNGLAFVDNISRLAGFSSSVTTVLAPLLHSIKVTALPDSGHRCELSVQPATSILCLGTQDSSLEPRHVFVANVFETNGTTKGMVGIATTTQPKHLATAIGLNNASVFSTLLSHLPAMDSASIILASSEGNFQSVEPDSDQLSNDLAITSFSRSTLRIPGPGKYFAGRLNIENGFYSDLKSMGTTLSNDLLDGLEEFGIAQLADLSESLSDDTALEFSTRLRGELLWPNDRLILREGGSVVHRVYTTKKTEDMLRGNFEMKFARTLPISFEGAKYGNGLELVHLRASGNLRFIEDQTTRNRRIGGLLTFRTIGADGDPQSAFLSSHVRFKQGTMGVRTDSSDMRKLQCAGVSVSSSWGFARERDPDTSIETYYRHEINLNLALHSDQQRQFTRTVDAFAIEATLRDISALDLMQPLVDIASTQPFAWPNKALLSTIQFPDAIVSIHENPSAIGKGNIQEGCLPSPARGSSIAFDEMRVGNSLPLRSIDGSYIVMNMNLTKAGPGMYANLTEMDLSPYEVTTSGDFDISAPYIGSILLEPASTYSGVHASVFMATQRAGNTTSDSHSFNLFIDAQISMLGATWQAKIQFLKKTEAILFFESVISTPVPNSFIFHMSDYVYAMELKTIVSKDVSMRASLITSSDDATSASLKSHFAVNVEAKSNADTDLLEMYAREVDLIITKHWNDTLSDVVHGMDVSSSSKQLSICHSHPLRFGACIAASYHMLASEEMSKNGRAARRFLTDTDRANAATARLSLLRATEALRTISPGSSKLRRIRVSSTIFTPMSEYLRDVEELRRKRSSLARCELLSGDNPKPCANLAFEVQNLEGNVSSSSQWTSWVSRRNTEVDAEVAGIIAGGTEKTFVLHARSLHLHTFSQAVFVAYLDDIHASFAELFARHITGRYRYPQNDIELEDGGCMNPTVVERLYPTRCSKYPPPTSSNDAKIDWNGWDDVAGLLDLARALQREGLNMLGIRDPLTSVSDQTKIVKSSFSTSVIVASSSRTDEGGVQSHEVTTIVDELNQRYQMNGITSDLRDGGAFHHSLMLSEDTSDRSLQLHAVTSTGIPRYELTRSYAASTNPLLWANLSLEGDVNDPQKKSAAAWGCHITREPGVDFSSDLWKANRENDMDRFARTALRAASRDFLNQSMADCGPEEGSASRRSLLHAPSLTHQLARAHIRKPLLMILRGVLGFAFLFVARVFAYGNRGPSRLTRISHARVLAVVLITVTAYFSCVTAQDSSCERSKASKLFQLAAKEINLGVEFNCSGIEDYPIGFTVPSFEVGDLSIAESSFEGSISLSPGSKLDFSEASYDISASAVNTFAVTYTDLFRLEISGVAVSATKKSAQDDVSWTFDGTIGELGLNIDAKASQIKSVVIDGDINDDSSEEYTRDVLSLFSSVFGDGLELNKIFVELNNDANKWDVFVKLGVSLWGADASLVANITDGEFRSIDAAITLSDNAFVKLRGVPPCSKTEGESLNGIISYNPGTESSDPLELTATVEAQCDSANKVTKLTVKANMNGPFQLDMGPLLALNVKEEDTVALIYSREYAKDEYAYLFLNVVAYPMNVTASLAESNSFIIKIGDRSSANAVDWDNAMVSIGDSEGTLRSILPSAFIGENALALHYFELRLETPDDQVEYDLACLFKVGGITVNGTVQAVGASQRLEVNRFTLSVISDDAELRMTSEGEGVVKASFQMKEEIGIGFFHILPFSLHGSIIFSDNGHYDLSIAQRDDEKVTIRFFGEDVEFSFVEAAYSSLDGTLSFSGLVQDLFTVRYDKVGLSILDAPENDAKKNRKAFLKRTTNLIARNMFDLSAQNLNGKSFDKLNILGKILRDTFSVPDDIGINYLSIQSNDESNEGITKVSFEYIRYEFRTAFNVSYNNGTLVDIDAVLSSGPLYIQVKGTSLCGEDGTGGTLDGEVELKEGGLAILPTGFKLPVSISFQCTDGTYVGMDFLAELDDVTINLDAVDVRIDRLKVQYDTSSRNLMFSGIFGDGKVEVQFEYCPHDVASSSNKTNALTNSKSKSKSSSKSDMSMSLSVIIAEDIEFSALHDKLLSADAKDAAVGPMSTSSSCGDVGSEVLSSKIKKGSFLEMELNDAGVSFALVGNIQLFGADLRLMLLAENLGSKKSSRFLASVQISADASNLPDVIASAAEKAGGSLDIILAIANKEGTYHVPAIDDHDSNEHSTRRLLAEGKTGKSGGETIEMEGIFMLKINPGEEDPYAEIKDSNGPLADGEFGTELFITVSSFSPLEFSIFVSVEIDLAIGDLTDPCATTATLRNIRGGIAVSPRSKTFFIASTFDVVIPRCSTQNDVKQPIPGETPDLVEVYGELGIKLPTFELVGKLALDAGDDGWQNPLNAGEKITLFRVELELGIIFNPPTISCITIYAVAQFGQLDGTIYLGLNLLPFPTVAFTLALENIGLGAALEPAFSAMGVDGNENESVLNDESFFSASFFRTWVNTRLNDLVINDDLTIPPGFGVVAKDVSLLYGLIEAEELSLIVAKVGHGAMIEAFANVKPINIMNIFQLKGRNADNPYLYMKVQVSTKATNLVYCSSGEIVFMGIKLGVTMNINSGNLDADCRQILEDRNVQIRERPSNVIDATGGIYIDASLTWGELYVNAFFMASTLKLWEKDAKLQFAFSIDTENDSSILTVIIRQMADALFGSLESAIDDMAEFAYRAVERAIDRVDEAQRNVEDARRDVNAGIDNAQRKVNNLQWSINDSRNKANYHCDECGFWSPGSCFKCPWYWAEVGVLEGLRWAAIGVLEIARAAVNSVLSVVQGTLELAKNALKLVRNALELLVETLKSCLDYVADLIKKGADALDAIIQIPKFNVGASLGDGKISAELSVTLNLFNSGSKAFSFEIDSLDLKNLCTSIMNGMTDAVQTFLVGFLPKSVRDAFNLRRRRRLQQLPPPSMVNVNCTDPVIVASCYPRCCNSAVGADVEANEEAYEMLRSRHFNLTAETTDEEIEAQSGAIFFAARAVSMENVGALPPYKASDRMRPQPKAKVVMSYTTTATEWADRGDLREKMISSLQSTVDRSIKGHESEALSPKAAFACSPKCYATTSDVLWQVEAGPFYFHDMPSMVEHLVTDQAETRLQIEMHGVDGLRSPKFVGLSAGSADSVFEHLPAARNFVDSKDISDAALGTDNDLGTCAESSTSFFNNPIQNTSTVLDVTVKKAWHESPGAIALISTVCATTVLLIAVPVRLLVKKRELSRFLGR